MPLVQKKATPSKKDPAIASQIAQKLLKNRANRENRQLNANKVCTNPFAK
jgi:hypothetical protein